MSQQPEKLLHREQTIRAAGALFILAPFFNLFMVVWTSSVANKWTLPILWQFIKAGTWVQWGMQVAALIVGFMMLKGRRETWMPVLGILLVFIVHGVLNYKAQKLKMGAFVPTVSLLINVGLFILVYYQEYWQIAQMELKKTLQKAQKAMPNKPQMELPKFELPKIKTEALKSVKDDLVAKVQQKVSVAKEEFSKIQTPEFLKKSAPAEPKVIPSVPSLPPVQPTAIHREGVEAPFDLSLLTGIVIEFEGIGPWAELVSSSENEIHLETFAPTPEGLSTKPVEIVIGDVGVLKFRLTRQIENRVTFRLEKVERLKQLVS